MSLRGKHNIYNSMAAALAAKASGVSNSVIKEALRSFSPIEHRLEPVLSVKGVLYINDSKATNVDAAWYALECQTRPVVWIVGGTDKGNDYDVLKQLVKDKVKAIVCMGVDNHKFHEAFEDIVAKENKKFQYSIVKKGGRASQYIGSIQWLEDVGIVRRCYNTQITELPLEGNSIKDCFKVYTTDIGILMAMLDYGTQADILKGNLLGYKGAIFENLMADFLCKSGQKLYYFHKDSGLELDFLVRFKGECVILEVKAKSGKAKGMTTVLKNKDVYHVKNAIKLGQYNVGREGDILTIPLYMGFLIEDKLADVIIPDVDLSLLTTI
mgnify:CR=1 FL=1